MELLLTRVSGWSYCAVRSVGGAIAQYGQWVELLRNIVRGWSYCLLESVGGAIACVIESVGGARVTGN